VLSHDTATAEVWTKALLVAGAADAPVIAAEHELAALWVDDDRRLHLTPAAVAHVLWLAPGIDVQDVA
jgi:thiamine biosynthesis lipoprotein ApbE